MHSSVEKQGIPECSLAENKDDRSTMHCALLMRRTAQSVRLLIQEAESFGTLSRRVSWMLSPPSAEHWLILSVAGRVLWKI